MAGVELSDRDRVEEAIQSIRFERWPDWSREELLCHPTDAMELCDEVRLLTGLTWTDELILWCLYPAGKRKRRA